MNLTDVATDVLLRELNTRFTDGVIALISKQTGRLEAWWGNRTKGLGLTTRLAWSIQRELDDADEEDETEDETEDDALALEFPQLGQYL